EDHASAKHLHKLFDRYFDSIKNRMGRRDVIPNRLDHHSPCEAYRCAQKAKEYKPAMMHLEMQQVFRQHLTNGNQNGGEHHHEEKVLHYKRWDPIDIAGADQSVYTFMNLRSFI